MIKHLVAVLCLTMAVTAGAQTNNIRDLRLRDTSGDIRFRHNANGNLVSYTEAGVPTATWDSATGEFDGPVDSSNVTGLDTSLAAKADAVHPHIISDTTGLQTALDAKAPIASPTFTGTISGSGSGLTALNASNLGSGTVPDARFPSTLPAVSGTNLTNLDASDLASGTVGDARLSAAGQDAISKRHSQGTDTGTNATTFRVGNAAGSGGVTLAFGDGSGMDGTINYNDSFSGFDLDAANLTTSGHITAQGFTGDASGLDNLNPAALSGAIDVSAVPNGVPATALANGTISNTEFQYLNGVTGTIQTQLDAKPDTLGEAITAQGLSGFGSANQVLATNSAGTGYEWATVSGGGGGVSLSGNNTWTGTNTFNNDVFVDGTFTAYGSGSFDGALSSEGTITAGSGFAGIQAANLPSSIDATKIGGGGVTSAEFDYIATLSSNAQTQISARLPATITAAATGEYIRYNGSAWVDASIAAADLPSSIDATKIGGGGVTTTEFGYIGTLSSDAQTQLNARGTLTGTNTWSGTNTFSAATNRFTANTAFGGASSPSHSVVVGLDMGDIGFATGKAVVIAHNAAPGALLAVGQDATHQLQFRWDYTAIANNAVANLVTYSYQNPLNIDVKDLNLQQNSNGGVKISSATGKVGFFGVTPIVRATVTGTTTLEQLKQTLEDYGLVNYTP